MRWIVDLVLNYESLAKSGRLGLARCVVVQVLVKLGFIAMKHLVWLSVGCNC